ncbi:DNA-binding protein [Atlantibacter hermannii]|uniref:DNA-binding protein n=1 Tax=Atlantibacter hermannii TaxID=565 RepID=UPI002169C743|nr:DNA-binding protein [Atlantibacter hermannii]
MDSYSISFLEACGICGVSEPTLRKWIRSGRLVASRKSDKPRSQYILTRQACIAAVNNPLHTVIVSAVDGMKEESLCQFSAEVRPGTPVSHCRTAKDLNSLLGQRTKGRQRNFMTS